MENKDVMMGTSGVQTVEHKIFGTGVVVDREERDGIVYVNVRFKNGMKKRLAIPDSFLVGVVSAEGSLKDEVDAVVAERAARTKAKWEALEAESAAHAAAPSARRGRTPAAPVAVKSTIQDAFEEYLANAGYREYTPSGNRSTVYSYSNAIKANVLENEHMTWSELWDDIDCIIHKYDVGGPMQRVGEKSNSTVIDALKRFGEFVHG